MNGLAKSKSLQTQCVLALLFGPIGLLYSSFTAGTLLMLAGAVLAKDFGWPGLFSVWPMAVASGFFTVRRWNRRAAEYGHAHTQHASSEQRA